MSSCINLKEWLLENGGPAIQLQINKNSSNHQINNGINNVSKLLQLEKVTRILDYLDGFETESRDNKVLEHLIHYYKDTCIENFFPQLMELGFSAGIPNFDKKMKSVKEVYSYLLSNNYIYSLMMSRFFFMAGYSFTEVINAVIRRINILHQAANEKIFDIYQDKAKLPAVPKHWIDKGVLKDELNPFRDEKPLPTIYDITAMAYFPKQYMDSEIQTKIDDIITYVLEPRFQEIPEGYGLLWVKSRRIYHGCGWSPTLPCYENYNRPAGYDIYWFLYYFNLMSCFKKSHESKWFKCCLEHTDQFQTEKGTYIFPKEYLHQKYITEAFLNESNMRLKQNEREKLQRELISTLFMLKIRDRITE